MGRIRKQQVKGFDRTTDELPPIDIESWVGRLREMSKAQMPEADPFAADAQAEADARRQVIDRRRARLGAAGGVDPDAADAAAISIGACPRIVGHRGSERAADAVKAFLDSRFMRTMLLCGPPGRGKSFVATWVVAEFQLSSMWMAASEARVGDRWHDLRTKAEAAKLLVIDDLGRESTDWASRELGDMIELRHNRGSRTVATTNLTRDQVMSKYGDRLASRLGDTRMAVLVDVLGADMRKR